ncbi:Resuscitation-promoting factor RpfA precursor [Streptomyces sp. ADI96-02]|uniref:transglycosylase family protein n=1 Tax=unclassified Streptomyces TaxID=2593676 RepID=UPI000F558E87|nr:Resuscitation-promoting factor RpfA precursor [Streptomyces sp. ADI96-02]
MNSFISAVSSRSARSLRGTAGRKWAVRVGTTAGAVALGVTGLAATSAQAADASRWDRLAACESGGKWTTNTGNGFAGGLQFTPSTWKAYGGHSYASAAHNATKSEQIAVAERVLAGQGPGAWPVCSKVAGMA